MTLYTGDSQRRTRFNLMDVFPRGTQGDGNANNLIGSGTDIPLVIKVPAAQSVDSLDVQTAAGAVLWSVDKAGNVIQSGFPNISNRVIQVPLTSAQIISMFTTPISIIPAPAAGSCIVVEQILFELDLTSTAFTGGGVVHFYYHGQTTEIMAETIAAATVQGTVGRYLFILTPVATAGGAVVTTDVGIDITCATQVFAAGTGTAKITVWYDLITEG